MKTRYIHTINGRPGTFDGWQVCYSIKTRPITTCATLAELKKQRRLSERNRANEGYSNKERWLSHRRVLLP